METRTEMFDKCMVKNVNRANQNLQELVLIPCQGPQSDLNFVGYIDVGDEWQKMQKLSPTFAM